MERVKRDRSNINAGMYQVTLHASVVNKYASVNCN
jgi:hypothetical protein